MSVEEACESLLEALEARRTDIVKSLLDHLAGGQAGAITPTEVLACQCCEAGTLLHQAVETGQRDAVRALLIAGANPGLTNARGETALQLATSPQVLQTFSDELLRAVAGSDKTRVEQLLEAGLGPGCVDSVETGNTALHWAACFSDAAMVELLVARGAEVDKVNSEGCSALHDAVGRGEEEIVRVLLESGAGPDLVATAGRQKGQSPRQVAEGKGRLGHLFPAITNGVHEAEKKEVEEELPSSPMKEVREPSPPLVQDPLVHILWPAPRHLTRLAELGEVEVPTALQLVVGHLAAPHTIHSVVDVLQTHRGELLAAGHTLAIRGREGAGLLAGPGDLLVSMSEELGKEEYSLTITPSMMRVAAGGAPGLHYAIYTLIQLLHLHPGAPLPALDIRDSPALPVRAVLLDLAQYGRLPTVDTLTSTLLALTRIKVNQVQLYCRLTSAATWQLPYTEGDLIALDRHCSDRAVSLQPALDIPQPCPAAELPNYTAAFSRLLACFSSTPSLHLGPCLSSVLLSTPSLLPSLHTLLGVPPSTSLYLCSNSLPVSAPSLPSTLGLVEYGFQSDHPWSSTCHRRTPAGLPLLLCPGTAAWSCLLGRPPTMRANIQGAAAAAHATGARGLVVAHWAGAPALAPLTGALPGWVLGAGLAWSPLTSPAHLGAALTTHLLADTQGAAGRVLLELGEAEARLAPPTALPSLQPSLLLSLVMRPSGAAELAGIGAEEISRVVGELRRSLATLSSSREGGGGPGEGMIQEVIICSVGTLCHPQSSICIGRPL